MWQRGIVKWYTVYSPLNPLNSFLLPSSLLRKREDSCPKDAISVYLSDSHHHRITMGPSGIYLLRLCDSHSIPTRYLMCPYETAKRHCFSNAYTLLSIHCVLKTHARSSWDPLVPSAPVGRIGYITLRRAVFSVGHILQSIIIFHIFIRFIFFTLTFTLCPIKSLIRSGFQYYTIYY